MSNLKYEPVSEIPVARFWYKGQSHTHPIRRTGLIVEWNKSKGYFKALELREGRTVRAARSAPVKTYSFTQIAKGENLRAGSRVRRKYGKRTTLQRTGLMSIVTDGV